ncbi:hypothetical protein HYPSUDRAFT_205372 [Hypholoma sublateritium FD-334 SS-4]|uniref:Uncharacterized protein n=1 Tax=Hypholoma sublateritium (strain FD-334 SS-4) TaxID=945553 RepID=A0A0D2M5B3_HYPSF|nr:hypothetical protein HYPSUDRAFT_205372 [Hypholoma sublateritium FD-334 SS-4]
MSSNAYHRSSSPSESSDAGSQDSFSFSHIRGVYVPLHKRSGPPSSTTSLSEASSSRGTSPSKSRHHGPSVPPSPPVTNPRIYTMGYLLSLRPFATEGLKDQMRTTCPEVVMNRRMRKSIEFNENQTRAAQKVLIAQQRILQQQQQFQQQLYQPHQQSARPHGHPRYSPATSTPVPAHPTHTRPHATDPPSTHSRRVRPTERNSEHTREASAHHASWNALGSGGAPPVAA